MCRKHVVFGKVVKGMDILKKMEQVGSADGKPSELVKIVDCGETSDSKTNGKTGDDKGIIGFDTQFSLKLLCELHYPIAAFIWFISYTFVFGT